MTRPAGDRAYALTACAVMFLWPVVTTDFARVNAVAILVALSALILGALVFLYNVSPWLVTIVAVASGIALRLTTDAYSGSDVANATAEALRAIAAGTSPYHHVYHDESAGPAVSVPSGRALALRHPAANIRLAARPRPVVEPRRPARDCGTRAGMRGQGDAGDGASRRQLDEYPDRRRRQQRHRPAPLTRHRGTRADVRVARSSSRKTWLAAALYALSAALFGWALAFKALVWIAFPFVVRAIAPRRRLVYLLGAIGVALAFSVPFAIGAPVDFFHSIGSGFTSHDNVWGFNVWAALEASHPAIVTTLLKYSVPVAIFATLFTAMTLWTRKPASLGEALLQNCIVLAAMLLFARWTSLAYYAFLIGTFALAIATFGFELEPPQAAAP